MVETRWFQKIKYFGVLSIFEDAYLPRRLAQSAEFWCCQLALATLQWCAKTRHRTVASGSIAKLVGILRAGPSQAPLRRRSGPDAHQQVLYQRGQRPQVPCAHVAIGRISAPAPSIVNEQDRQWKLWKYVPLHSAWLNLICSSSLVFELMGKS